jgi:hypothetical protein
MDAGKDIQPELRLYPMCLGGILFPIGFVSCSLCVADIRTDEVFLPVLAGLDVQAIHQLVSIVLWPLPRRYIVPAHLPSWYQVSLAAAACVSTWLTWSITAI